MRSRNGVCPACRAPITWLLTDGGKNIPCEPGSVQAGQGTFSPSSGHVAHFGACARRTGGAGRPAANDEPPAHERPRLSIVPDLSDELPPPYMDGRRVAEFEAYLRSWGLTNAEFKAVRTIAGLSTPVDIWTEAEYRRALAIGVEATVSRDAMRKGLPFYLQAKGITGPRLEAAWAEYNTLMRIAPRTEATG